MNILAGREDRAATPKWAPDIEPVVMCMACEKQFPEPPETCPHCHISVSRVRMCPDCRRWVAAVHTKCVYCSRSFLVDSDGPARLQSSSAAAPRDRWRWKNVRHLVVSAIVFLVVFSGLLHLTRIHQKPAAPKPHKIATSYALRRASVYSAPSLSGAVIGHVDPAEVVNVVAFASPGLPEHWLQITGRAVTGYVAMRDFAPPKPVNAEEGYALLRSVLLVTEDPNVMLLADDAVSYYGQAFPTSPHREELAWLLAERARRVSEHAAARAQLLPLARKRYQEVAGGGGALAEDARKQLDELPDLRPTAAARRSRRTVDGMEIIGGSLTSGRGASAHHVLILQQTEVLVRIAPLPKVAVGTVFPGHIARDIPANKEIAVPAGSECQLKVLKLARVGPAEEGTSATVQLVRLYVGDRKLTVNADPIQIPLSDEADTSFRVLKFKINTPLVISN